MAWTYLDWYRHLTARHGYNSEFAYMIPATRSGAVTRHEMDHDELDDLDHVHVDPKDPSKTETR